ncbi:hypothetical protein EV653_4416 [Kribbella pratensis]|uniref:Uncharacterized protein n=1 Tax=Kribbella pratensis TaxID=2512112 RepID=A0A4R8CA41_9ACTN|nr:hypothetical protein EV653_4416 [Kribbella pratensis]
MPIPPDILCAIRTHQASYPGQSSRTGFTYFTCAADAAQVLHAFGLRPFHPRSAQ